MSDLPPPPHTSSGTPLPPPSPDYYLSSSCFWYQLINNPPLWQLRYSINSKRVKEDERLTSESGNIYSTMAHPPLSCTSAELIDLVDRALSQPSGQSIIIVATASNSAETGLPWCPDCIQAKAAIDSALQLAQQQDGQFSASVAICALSREEWKSEHGQSNHPLRLHSQLMVGGIPFVARVVDGKIAGRATEEECFGFDDLLRRLKMSQ